MSGKSFNLRRFWQELKRRRVIHVITVYASSSFIIIELINNLSEPLNLPVNLLTIVVILLAVGFPFAIILSWLFDLTSKGVERTKPLSEEVPSEKTAVPSAWKIATIVSFVVIAGLIVFNIVGINKQAYAASVRSLVVLPFGNYTGDDQLEYFVDGMHSSLIGGIGQLSGLRVLGETTANAYKEADKSLPVIASELNVDAALESTVMCLGDSICLQVKLISTFPEERQLWVGNFKEEKSEIMNLYNRIVRQIASEVKIKLTPSERTQLKSDRKHNPALLEAVYKGRFHMNQLTPEGFKLGLKFLEEAIAIDSLDPLPYIGLAHGYSLAGHVSGLVPNAAELAVENAHKALAIDSTLAEAYVVLATGPLYTEWDFPKAERYLKRALDLNHNIAMAHYHYGWYWLAADRLDKAIAEFEISKEIDPADVTYTANLAGAYIWIGQYEKGLEEVENALELNPVYPMAVWTKGTAYAKMGRYVEAIEIHEKGLAASPGFENGLGTAYALAGQKENALEVIAQLEDMGLTWYTWAIAEIFTAMGEYDSAIYWVEEAVERRHDFAPWFKVYALFEPLYGDPRFQEIVNRINYPE
jgi:tetratricopeptide (TPR) repeat protein